MTTRSRCSTVTKTTRRTISLMDHLLGSFSSAGAVWRVFRLAVVTSHTVARVGTGPSIPDAPMIYGPDRSGFVLSAVFDARARARARDFPPPPPPPCPSDRPPEQRYARLSAPRDKRRYCCTCRDDYVRNRRWLTTRTRFPRISRARVFSRRGAFRHFSRFVFLSLLLVSEPETSAKSDRTRCSKTTFTKLLRTSLFTRMSPTFRGGLSSAFPQTSPAGSRSKRLLSILVCTPARARIDRVTDQESRSVCYLPENNVVRSRMLHPDIVLLRERTGDLSH